MLSSVNSFSGLSAVNVLQLFGANSPAPSATTNFNLSTIGVVVSLADDPAKAIQTILAKAHVEKASIVATGSGSGVAKAVQAYSAHDPTSPTSASAGAPASGMDALLAQAHVVQSEAEQTVAGLAYGQRPDGVVTRSVLGSRDASGQARAELAVTQSALAANATTAYAAQTAQGLVTSLSFASGGVSMWAGEGDQEHSSRIFSSISATSVALTPPSAASGGSNVPPQSASEDSFRVALAVDNQAVSFEFALDGLGRVAPTEVGTTYSVGKGPLADYFQGVVNVDGHGMVFEFSVLGLDKAQAQRVTSAFEKATCAGFASSAKSTMPARANEHQYTVDYGPHLSISFLSLTGYRQPGDDA